MNPFHLAIAVNNLEETRVFYETLFDAEVGRETEKWIDFNFFGHQPSVHLKPDETGKSSTNIVDGKSVPARHFGIVLDWVEWHLLADKLRGNEIKFIIDPCIRFKGRQGEQATMFLSDPSGNALEFKSFKDSNLLFVA